MPPSARTYMGIILIFFGRSTLFGARGAARCEFSTNEATSPHRHIQTKTPYLACKEFIF